MGIDICSGFGEDPPGGDPSAPNSIDAYCSYGGRLHLDRGDYTALILSPAIDDFVRAHSSVR